MQNSLFFVRSEPSTKSTRNASKVLKFPLREKIYTFLYIYFHAKQFHSINTYLRYFSYYMLIYRLASDP